MTHPDDPPRYDPPRYDPPPKRESLWPGFLLGLFVVAPAVMFLTFHFGQGILTLVFVVLAGSGVLLFTRHALARGIGAGVLSAFALAVIVLLGMCFSYLQDMS